jgi:hypothetical protein
MKLIANLISVAILDVLVMVKRFPEVGTFILFKIILYLNANITFGSSPQRLIESEEKHWHTILERLFANVQKLAEMSLAFRGQCECLCGTENGIVLAQVELLAKCNPVM